jgi:hypothetical protein
VVALCVLAACGDSGSDETTASSTTTVVGLTTSSVAPSTTRALSTGNYNVTPLRSDGQRVTFRLTLADGVTGEVSLTPANTTIDAVEPKIELVRPNGQAGGGGDIFTTRADDPAFDAFCASALGGNCKPRSTEDLREGNRLETYALAAGGTINRVVFGQWAIMVHGRDVADAFTFRIGPDGFPLVAARASGWRAGPSALYVDTQSGARYVLRSDPSGTCSVATGSRVQCDRGLSVEPVATSPDASIRRIN